MTVTPAYARPVEGDLRVGHIFSSAWTIFSANFPTFFVIGLVVALPNLLLFMTVPTEQTAFGPTPTGAIGWRLVVGWVLAMVLNLMSQAIILYIAFQYLRGQPAPVGDAVQKGLARFLPILGLVVLFALGVWVGLLLLVIPGIMLMIRWSVSVPACVVEGTGPVQPGAQRRPDQGPPLEDIRHFPPGLDRERHRRKPARPDRESARDGRQPVRQFLLDSVLGGLFRQRPGHGLSRPAGRQGRRRRQPERSRVRLTAAAIHHDGARRRRHRRAVTGARRQENRACRRACARTAARAPGTRAGPCRNRAGSAADLLPRPARASRSCGRFCCRPRPG